MLGECDNCGEHALECRCLNDFQALRLRIICLQEIIKELQDAVDSLDARLDFVEHD